MYVSEVRIRISTTPHDFFGRFKPCQVELDCASHPRFRYQITSKNMDALNMLILNSERCFLPVPFPVDEAFGHEYQEETFVLHPCIAHVMRNEMIASKPRKRDGRQKRENLVKERKKCLLSKEQRKIDPIFLRRIHVV